MNRSAVLCSMAAAAAAAFLLAPAAFADNFGSVVYTLTIR